MQNYLISFSESLESDSGEEKDYLKDTLIL